MRRALALALLLASPSAARAQRLSVVTAAPVTWGQVVPVLGDYPVMPGSVECHGVALPVYVPTFDRVTEIRYWTIKALTFDLQSGKLTAPAGADVAIHLLGYIPAPRFYDKPLYGRYRHWVTGEPYWGCAQGIAAFDGPKVAADNPARTERLVCFETVNWYLGAIQRTDLWDSAYTQSIENTVGSQLTGGWRTN